MSLNGKAATVTVPGLRVYPELAFRYEVFQRDFLLEFACGYIVAQQGLRLPGQEPYCAVFLVDCGRSVCVEVFSRAASDGAYVAEESACCPVIQFGRSFYGCAYADVVVAESVVVARCERLDPAVHGYEFRLASEFGQKGDRSFGYLVDIDADQISVIFPGAAGR